MGVSSAGLTHDDSRIKDSWSYESYGVTWTPTSCPFMFDIPKICPWNQAKRTWESLEFKRSNAENIFVVTIRSRRILSSYALQTQQRSRFGTTLKNPVSPWGSDNACQGWCIFLNEELKKTRILKILRVVAVTMLWEEEDSNPKWDHFFGGSHCRSAMF